MIKTKNENEQQKIYKGGEGIGRIQKAFFGVKKSYFERRKNSGKKSFSIIQTYFSLVTSAKPGVYPIK
jgi:hypothetical protein